MSDTSTIPPEPDTADWARLQAAYTAAETAETEASTALTAAIQRSRDAEQAVVKAQGVYGEASEHKLDLVAALESYRANWIRLNALEGT